MGRFTKRLICGFAVASLMAGSAFAQDVSVLDDFTGGTNQNKFGAHWYFFDDSKMVSWLDSVRSAVPGGNGNSEVKSARFNAVTGELLFEKAAGSLIATDRSGGVGDMAVLDYVLGRTFSDSYNGTSIDLAREPVATTCAAQPAGAGCFDSPQTVGIGSNLVPEGRETGPSGIQNATIIRFWAKADPPVSVRFVLETSDIGHYTIGGQSKRKSGAEYGKWIYIEDDWKQYQIRLASAECSGTGRLPDASLGWPFATCKETDAEAASGGRLVQPDWAFDQQFIKPLVLRNAVKVAWQIQASDQPSAIQGNNNKIAGASVGAAGKFYLDNVEFVGFRFVPEDMCEGCIVTRRPADSQRFDAFNVGPQNRLSHYWYAYDDTKAKVDDGTDQGSSANGPLQGVTPATVDCSPNEYREPDECGLNVFEDEDGEHAIGMRFVLGENLTIDGHTVMPFVGLGTNLYKDKEGVDKIPDANLEFYDATADGVQGLYFEYYTDMEKITFEVQDNRDVIRSGPARPESGVHYIDLPGKAAGEAAGWKSAMVPFNKLVMHTEWEDVANWVAADPDKGRLNLEALAKFQFKIQTGGAATAQEAGQLKIRNVYTLGAEGSAVRLLSSNAKTVGLRATYNRGVVGVNWNPAAAIASGKVSLVNVKGRVVSSAPISSVSGGRVTANLSAKGGIPSGMYFVRVDARDVNGKRVFQQAPISVVR